jgi:hypothetical protein
MIAICDGMTPEGMTPQSIIMHKLETIAAGDRENFKFPTIPDVIKGYNDAIQHKENLEQVADPFELTLYTILCQLIHKAYSLDNKCHKVIEKSDMYNEAVEVLETLSGRFNEDMAHLYRESQSFGEGQRQQEYTPRFYQDMEELQHEDKMLRQRNLYDANIDQRFYNVALKGKELEGGIGYADLVQITPDVLINNYELVLSNEEPWDQLKCPTCSKKALATLLLQLRHIWREPEVPNLESVETYTHLLSYISLLDKEGDFGGIAYWLEVNRDQLDTHDFSFNRGRESSREENDGSRTPLTEHQHYLSLDPKFESRRNFFSFKDPQGGNEPEDDQRQIEG